MNEEHIKQLKEYYNSKGWKLDQDDEEKLCFSVYIDEDLEWYRDYDKKTGYSCTYNARQTINLISKDQCKPVLHENEKKREE